MGSSHHGDQDAFIAEQLSAFKDALQGKQNDFLQTRFAEQVAGTAKPLFPEGKIKKDDEGALAFRIAADQEKKVVVIDFGKQVSWLGLPKAEALGLAELLKAHAETL